MWDYIFIGNICLLLSIFFVMGIGHLTYADYYTNIDGEVSQQVFIGIIIVVLVSTLLFGMFVLASSNKPNTISMWKVYGFMIFLWSCLFYIIVGSQLIIHFYKKTRLYFGIKRNKVRL